MARCVPLKRGHCLLCNGALESRLLSLLPVCHHQSPQNEIMSVNPQLEKKTWKEEEKEAPVHGSFGWLPPFLKGLFIKSVLSVSCKSWICGFPVPWSQKGTERHFVVQVHRFCDAHIYTETLRDPRSVWGRLSGCRSLDSSFVAIAIVPRTVGVMCLRSHPLRPCFSGPGDRRSELRAHV